MDWAIRYRERNTPWDMGRAHPSLAHALGAGELKPPHDGARALVPGCGRAHDALALAEAGWRVTALDLVKDLAAHVGERLAPYEGTFEIGDALRYDGGGAFDLVLEHTFFCAIPPERRSEYGPMVRRALAVGGRLAAVIFPEDRPYAEQGPPWRITVDDIGAELGRGFALRENERIDDTLTHRRWAERWAVWERVRG